jgi:integrase
VYERRDRPDGPLLIRTWDPTGGKKGRGGWVRRSLGHRDKEQAKQTAADLHAARVRGEQPEEPEAVTLGRILDLYSRHRTPRKCESGQKSDARSVELWGNFLGRGKDPLAISLREWESFIDLRMSGAIDARGHEVPEKERRAVSIRAPQLDLRWLRWLLNWACNWRVGTSYLLDATNPVRGLPIPEVKNPKRPVADTNRFEIIRAKTDDVMMEVTWFGKRKRVRSHLSELFDLAYGTGRRIGSIVSLRYSDDLPHEGPYGSLRWRAAHDKQGRESVVPVTPRVRAALDRIKRERPGIGDAPLFPAPKDPQRPVDRHLVDSWLRKAERLAGVEPQRGGLWHPYRRGWATRRKGLPIKDVMEAGGWSDTTCLQTCYQQPDEETVLAVVLADEPELRRTG